MGRLKLKPRRTAAHQTGKTPMSGHISELIRPYWEGDPEWLEDPSSLEGLGHIAGLAWNLSRIERVEGTSEIESKALADVAAMGGQETLEEMLGRARAMGPRESRLVTSVEVAFDGEQVKVVAASTGW